MCECVLRRMCCICAIWIHLTCKGMFDILAPLAATGGQALSHCQVPCGIFEDQARVKAMMEDAVTIRKAMVQTGALSSKVASGDAQSLNQSCRWIGTKDEHADKIISTTAQYFLAQRVVVWASFPVHCIGGVAPCCISACPRRELHNCIAEIVLSASVSGGAFTRLHWICCLTLSGQACGQPGALCLP